MITSVLRQIWRTLLSKDELSGHQVSKGALRPWGPTARCRGTSQSKATKATDECAVPGEVAPDNSNKRRAQLRGMPGPKVSRIPAERELSPDNSNERRAPEPRSAGQFPVAGPGFDVSPVARGQPRRRVKYTKKARAAHRASSQS